MGFIPLIVFRESVQYSELVKRLEHLANAEQVASLSSWVAAIVLAAGIVFAWLLKGREGPAAGKSSTKYFFAGFFGIYIFPSYLVTGALGGQFHLNHHLYVANFIVIFLLLNRLGLPAGRIQAHAMNFEKYRLLLFAVLLFIVLLALVSISIHDGMSGAQERFPV